MADRNTTQSWLKYKRSTAFLAQGSSTSSKAPTFRNVEPALIDQGQGCRIWDTDGNEYIDFRNALGPITLGYCVKEIDEAIVEQLKRGIIFGHPHALEGEVAEMLTAIVPCAQRVRFLKTGGEALAACIKIARSTTRRNRILQCGYNGWLNILSSGGRRPTGIAASEPLNGVPVELGRLHKSLPWGDIEPWREAFKEHGDEIAAVVIACNYSDMEKGKCFLPALRKLTNEYGALLVYDEIVTGFRLAPGGAQEYFDAVPDMAVFGKGLANGMPLSVYAGRADLIDSARDIGISSTFAGETLSLAAARATMHFYEANQVISHLWRVGETMWSEVNRLFKQYGVDAVASGFPVCPEFMFGCPKTASRFFKACYAQGVSLYQVSYVNFSHKESDITETHKRIEAALSSITCRD